MIIFAFLKKILSGFIILLFVSGWSWAGSVMSAQQRLETIQKQQQAMLQKTKKLLQQQKKLNQRLANLTALYSPYDFAWQQAKPGNIPQHAVNAGLTQSSKIYICRAAYKGLGIHPGRVVPQGCLITYGGQAILQKHYSILTGLAGKTTWQAPHASSPSWQNIVIPPHLPYESQAPAKEIPRPIIGGYEKNHFIAICRAIYDNKLYVGKAVKQHCNIAWRGQEKLVSHYQVLVNNNGG
jgi:hypothetical protein